MPLITSPVELVLSALLGLGVGFAALKVLLQISRRFPNFLHRQCDLHHGSSISIPRVGGIALAGTFLSAVLFAAWLSHRSGYSNNDEFKIMVIGSLLMLGLGLWDDFQALGAKRKLIGQLLIASLVYFMGIGIHQFRLPFIEKIVELGFWSWPITVIWLVSMTNLINLIDGVDGLAGGICLMLMGLMIFVSGGMASVQLIAAGMVGGLLGFLFFNCAFIWDHTTLKNKKRTNKSCAFRGMKYDLWPLAAFYRNQQGHSANGGQRNCGWLRHRPDFHAKIIGIGNVVGISLPTAAIVLPVILTIAASDIAGCGRIKRH